MKSPAQRRREFRQRMNSGFHHASKLFEHRCTRFVHFFRRYRGMAIYGTAGQPGVSTQVADGGRTFASLAAARKRTNYLRT
jgi:hypothetical protein